jgi:hypothetical protein
VLGGGGQFGILTDLTVRFESLDDCSVYWIRRENKNGIFGPYFRAWEKLCHEGLSPSTSSKLQLDNVGSIAVFGVLRDTTGDDEKLRAFASAFGATIRVAPLTQEVMYQTLAGCKELASCASTAWTAKPEFFAAKSTMIAEPGTLSDRSLAAIAGKMDENTVADYAYLQVNRWCGAMRASNPTVCFPFRQFAYECQVYAKTDSPGRWDNQTFFDRWVDDVTSLLGDRRAAFLNHASSDALDHPEVYLGPSKHRIDAIKKQYDPENIFQVFQPADH